jgi:hypothetical protein
VIRNLRIDFYGRVTGNGEDDNGEYEVSGEIGEESTLEIQKHYKGDGFKIEILQGIIFGGKIHGFLPDDQSRFEIETAGQVWSGFWQEISGTQRTEFGVKFKLDQGVIFGFSGVEQQNYLVRGSYSNGGIKFTQSNYGTGGRTCYTGAIIKDGESLSIRGFFSTTDLDGIFQFE